MTVQEAITQFGYLKKDISDVPLQTFFQWFNIINRFAYRLIFSEEPERYIIEIPYTTTSGSGPNTQSLPADLENITEWNTGFFLQDGNGNKINVRLPLTSPNNSNTGYYFNGSNVVFTNPQDRTYTLRYIPQISEITSTTDTLVIPDDYTEYVLKALDVLYTQWDEDVTAESFADQRFTRVMDEMAQEIRRVPASYDMPDFSGTFNSGTFYGNNTNYPYS